MYWIIAAVIRPFQKIFEARPADEDNKLFFQKTAASFQNNYI